MQSLGEHAKARNRRRRSERKTTQVQRWGLREWELSVAAWAVEVTDALVLLVRRSWVARSSLISLRCGHQSRANSLTSPPSRVVFRVFRRRSQGRGLLLVFVLYRQGSFPFLGRGEEAFSRSVLLVDSLWTFLLPGRYPHRFPFASTYSTSDGASV